MALKYTQPTPAKNYQKQFNRLAVTGLPRSADSREVALANSKPVSVQRPDCRSGVNSEKRVYEDSSRERAYYSHRPFTTCAVSLLGRVKSSTSALTRSFGTTESCCRCGHHHRLTSSLVGGSPLPSETSAHVAGAEPHLDFWSLRMIRVRALLFGIHPRVCRDCAACFPCFDFRHP